MAQTASIAPGVAAANGAGDINIPANETWIIGIYTDAADYQSLLPEQSITVLIDTPSATDTIAVTLTRANPVVSIQGKCTVRVKRAAQPAGAANIGVFYNDQV